VEFFRRDSSNSVSSLLIYFSDENPLSISLSSLLSSHWKPATGSNSFGMGVGIAGSPNFAFSQGLRQRIGHRIETSEIESQGSSVSGFVSEQSLMCANFASDDG